MTTLIALGLMCLAVALVVFRPLWSLESDRSKGTGLERRSGLARYAEAQARILAESRDLIQARAEGKIDSGSLDEEQERIAAESGAAEIPSGASSSESKPVSPRSARTYPVWAVAGWVALGATSLGIAFLVNGQDIPRSSVMRPPAQAASDSMPIVGEDGEPDIGAMVGRLEARILAGKASAQDLSMLERSYGVLGREEEINILLRRAKEVNPGNPVIALKLGMRLLESGDPDALEEAEANFDELLESNTNLAEALWFKSLILIRREELGEAKTLLQRLQPLVKGNAEAEETVSTVLAELARIESARSGSE